jgi:cytochrome c556
MIRSKIKGMLSFALIVAAGATTLALAQMKPEDAIRARQSIMRVMLLNVGPLAGMAQGKIPFDKDVFTANALRLESIWAMNPAQYFLSGTDKPVPGSMIAGFTHAKPDIWSEPERFKEAQAKAHDAIAKLAQAARSGDEGAMKAAVGDVGNACKGCHDHFRSK